MGVVTWSNRGHSLVTSAPAHVEWRSTTHENSQESYGISAGTERISRLLMNRNRNDTSGLGRNVNVTVPKNDLFRC